MKYKKLTPNFSVENVKDTILFYQDILGFKLEMAVPNNENVIEQNIDENRIYNYAMMSKDEVFVMFLEETSLKKDMPIFKDRGDDGVVDSPESILFFTTLIAKNIEIAQANKT